MTAPRPPDYPPEDVGVGEGDGDGDSLGGGVFFVLVGDGDGDGDLVGDSLGLGRIVSSTGPVSVGDGDAVPSGFPRCSGSGANELGSTPASASSMNARQIAAGNEPPTTRMPRTSVIGLFELGYPFHTTAARSGV